MGGSSAARGDSGAPRVLLWNHRLTGIEGRGGIGRYVIELTRALADEAIRSEPPLRYELCAGPEPDEPLWVPEQLGVRRLGRNRRLLHLGWVTLRRPRVERLAGPAAVVHSLYPSFPLPTSAPLVVTVHDIFAIDHPEWFGRFESWTNRRGIAHAVERADHLITDSHYTKALLVEQLGVEPTRVSAIWPGTGSRLSSESEPVERDAVLARHGLSVQSYVLAVGAVNARKNLGVLVDALPDLPPSIKLVVAGPPAAAQRQLVDSIERVRLSDRVRLTGFLPDRDLRSLLESALALVHPSLDEGFGFTPLEAMAAGTPAIVASSGALPEIVGDGGVIVDGSDPESWANIIAALAADPDARERLVAVGRARVKEFSWRRTAKAVADVHRTLLKS